MNFVDEQNRFLAGSAQAIGSAGHDAPHLGYVAFHSAEAHEFRMRHLRDDVGKRSFASAGRTGQNDGRQPVGLDGAAQKFARPKDVLLPDEFVERARAHPCG